MKQKTRELDRLFSAGLFMTFAFVFASFFLSGCGGVPYRVHEGKVDTIIEQQSSFEDDYYIFAIGVAASDPALKNDTQRKALARDAAIVKAQYELLAYLKGVTLKGGVKVQRAMESDSVIESNINQLIRGAEVVRSEFTNDYGCVVTVRLPRESLDKVGELALQ